MNKILENLYDYPDDKELTVSARDLKELVELSAKTIMDNDMQKIHVNDLVVVAETPIGGSHCNRIAIGSVVRVKNAIFRKNRVVGYIVSILYSERNEIGVERYVILFFSYFSFIKVSQKTPRTVYNVDTKQYENILEPEEILALCQPSTTTSRSTAPQPTATNAPSAETSTASPATSATRQAK